MAKRSSLFLVVLLVGATMAQVRPSNDRVAVVGARVYTNPDAPALSNATVVVASGQITVVGERESVRIPAGTQVIDGTGLTVTAGFWNNHVHFTDRQWENAASLPPDQLSGRSHKCSRDTATQPFSTLARSSPTPSHCDDVWNQAKLLAPGF